MTTITLPRAVVEQALDALEYHVEQTRPIHRTSEAITALRAALAQQAEPAKTFLITGNEFCGAPPAPYATWGDALAGMLDAGKIEGLRISALRAALAQQAEPFTPDAIRTTQTAWKMGYDAAKAETQPAEPQTTHSAECWRWHHRCAVAKIERECKHD